MIFGDDRFGVVRRETLDMGDRARHTVQGRFLLLGRADRIVKVMEKRVSLDALEHHLQHP